MADDLPETQRKLIRFFLILLGRSARKGRKARRAARKSKVLMKKHFWIFDSKTFFVCLFGVYDYRVCFFSDHGY